MAATSPTSCHLPPEQDRTYQPDSLWSYELGAKTSWLDRRLIANTSFYYIDWSNIQVSDFTDNTNALTFIANAGKARVYGGEFELEARPVKDLTLGGSLALIEAQLSQDQPSTNQQFAGHAGDLFPNVPQVSGSLFAEATHPVTTGLQGFSRVDYSYTGRQGTQFSPTNPIYNVIPAYVTCWACALGVRADMWEAALFRPQSSERVRLPISSRRRAIHAPCGRLRCSRVRSGLNSATIIRAQPCAQQSIKRLLA